MELSERYIAQLEKDGFSHINEYQDEAGTKYPEHIHRGRVTICLTDGSLTLIIEGKIKELVAPMVYEVPVGVPHSTIVGPKGVIYIVGEEIEGDF